jgi:hypothetical protein
MKRTAARIATTLVAVVSLLFMQLALASYVCPVAQPEPVMDMPCEDMAAPEPAGAPVLCHQHCTHAAQSFEPLKLPTVTLPAVVQVLVVPLRVDIEVNRRAVAFASTGQAQPPPSPVFLSTLRLRV